MSLLLDISTDPPLINGESSLPIALLLVVVVAIIVIIVMKKRK